MVFDTHIHSKFSSDSDMNIESAIKTAKEKNIGIIVTDHMDLKFPIENEFIFDCNEYFSEYEKYRGRDFLIGIELGLRNDCIEENKSLSNSYPFDYVIGSIHVIDNIDIYQPIFYENKTKTNIYLHYLNTIYNCIKECDFIDSLGHIDYITRYSPYSDTELYYKDFADIIDEILKTLSTKEKALELNTRRINNKTAAQNMLDILKRFKELGGKYVTLGSDAHNTNAIGLNFEIAYELVEKSSLKIVYFKDRKIQ